MSEYEPRWYWCNLVDGYEAENEPDWSKVPEDRRERVRTAWQNKTATAQRVKLWGPQIAWYQRQPKYAVSVRGPA